MGTDDTQRLEHARGAEKRLRDALTITGRKTPMLPSNVMRKCEGHHLRKNTTDTWPDLDGAAYSQKIQQAAARRSATSSQEWCGQ